MQKSCFCAFLGDMSEKFKRMTDEEIIQSQIAHWEQVQEQNRIALERCNRNLAMFANTPILGAFWRSRLDDVMTSLKKKLYGEPEV